METKKCTKCCEIKSTEKFYKDSKKPTGFRSWCIDCQKSDNKKREHNYNETRRLYRLNKKEEYRAKKREYYIENKESILSGNSKWRQTFNGRLLSYKRSAKKRNTEWNLTDEEFKSFWQKFCNYCGSEIENIGIDRIDSNKSYEINNTISCCYGCNIGKMDYSYDEYINRVISIYENLKLWERIEKLREI